MRILVSQKDIFETLPYKEGGNSYPPVYRGSLGVRKGYQPWEIGVLNSFATAFNSRAREEISRIICIRTIPGEFYAPES